MSAPEHPAALGTYQVVRLLADRPIGRTLLGTDTTGRAVVLTLVHPAVAAGAGFRERFTAQARAAAAAPLWFVAAGLAALCESPMNIRLRQPLMPGWRPRSIVIRDRK